MSPRTNALMQKLKITTQEASALVENLKKSTHEADEIIKKLSGDKSTPKPLSPKMQPKLQKQGSKGSYKGFSRFVGSKKEILRNFDAGSRVSGLSETMIHIASNKQIAKPLFENSTVEKMAPT